MTKLVALNQIFDIRYGNQLDLNKLEQIKGRAGINFVSRISNNSGVICKVLRYKNTKPFNKGCITVTLGGTYLLSAFVQQYDFYTAQNIKILTPKDKNMTLAMKLFYCQVLASNKFRYTSHAREANKTLDYIKVPHPNYLPNYVEDAIRKIKQPLKESILDENIKFDVNKWKDFYIGNLFKIERGKEIVSEVEKGNINLISSSDIFNGLNKKIKEGKKIFTGNQITIANNGSVGACFYHSENLYATSDVSILTNNELNIYNSLFIVTAIRNEKYRFSYGRKWGLAKMKSHKIKLPATPQGEPDWQFMKNYIKSLPYTKNLESLKEVEDISQLPSSFEKLLKRSMQPFE